LKRNSINESVVFGVVQDNKKPPVTSSTSGFKGVEMAGIEPASENQFKQTSPSAANFLKFPYFHASRQA